MAVIGIPDERLGEAPRAFIVRQTNGLTEQMVTVEEQRYSAIRTMSYKT